MLGLLFHVLVLNTFAAPVSIEELPPRYEGEYKVQIQCRDTSPTERCRKLNGPAHLAILNTDLDEGVYVSICDPEFRFAQYVFRARQFEHGGSVARGEAISGSRPAEFELSVTGREVLMWIREAEFKQDLKVSGKLVASPGEFYNDAGPDESPAPYELQGQYKDRRATPAYLSIKKKLTSEPMALDGFFGAWVHSSGAIISFPQGVYRPEVGVLNLLSGESYNRSKWAAALRKNAKGERVWSVLNYSTAKCSASRLEFARD